MCFRGRCDECDRITTVCSLSDGRDEVLLCIDCYNIIWPEVYDEPRADDDSQTELLRQQPDNEGRHLQTTPEHYTAT